MHWPVPAVSTAPVQPLSEKSVESVLVMVLIVKFEVPLFEIVMVFGELLVAIF